MTRKRIFEIIEKGDADDKASLIFDKVILTLIILNVIAIILQSFQKLNTDYADLFRNFEVISVSIFSFELGLRIFTSDIGYPNLSKGKALIKYLLSPIAIVDIIAILPFYLPMFIAMDLRFLRILKLSRLLRVFKLNRYMDSMGVLSRVLRREKEQLLITVFMTFLLMLIASSMMYYIENEAQPDAFPNIIASFWWAIATLTTVGYGDVYPVTGLGRILSGVIALLGIGLVALPTGIISSGFLAELEEQKKRNEPHKDRIHIVCPSCGTHIVEFIKEEDSVENDYH